jgi:hypothetical protein
MPPVHGPQGRDNFKLTLFFNLEKKTHRTIKREKIKRDKKRKKKTLPPPFLPLPQTQSRNKKETQTENKNFNSTNVF